MTRVGVLPEASDRSRASPVGVQGFPLFVDFAIPGSLQSKKLRSLALGARDDRRDLVSYLLQREIGRASRELVGE